jgi:hypothetical protein
MLAAKPPALIAKMLCCTLVLERDCLVCALGLGGLLWATVAAMVTMSLAAWLTLDDREIGLGAIGKGPLKDHIALAWHGVLDADELPAIGAYPVQEAPGKAAAALVLLRVGLLALNRCALPAVDIDDLILP